VRMTTSGNTGGAGAGNAQTPASLTGEAEIERSAAPRAAAPAASTSGTRCSTSGARSWPERVGRHAAMTRFVMKNMMRTFRPSHAILLNLDICHCRVPRATAGAACAKSLCNAMEVIVATGRVPQRLHRLQEPPLPFVACLGLGFELAFYACGEGVVTRLSAG
jgi:hypothetical protein